jgi:hypothetical protein
MSNSSQFLKLLVISPCHCPHSADTCRVEALLNLLLLLLLLMQTMAAMHLQAPKLLLKLLPTSTCNAAGKA